MKTSYRFALVAAGLIFITVFAIAYPTYTGRTLKSGTTGCGGCHASESASVTVRIDGPDTLTAGTEGTYTVTISGGSGTAVCVDIATSAGVLKATDNTLKLSSNELITNGVKKYSGGSYSYRFTLVAPAGGTSAILYATGMSTKSLFAFAPNKAVVIRSSATEAESPTITTPDQVQISKNYPNPASADATVEFHLPQRMLIRLTVVDMSGRERAVLIDGSREAGQHSITWNLSFLPAGMYFYRITGSTPSRGEFALASQSLVISR